MLMLFVQYICKITKMKFNQHNSLYRHGECSCEKQNVIESDVLYRNILYENHQFLYFNTERIMANKPR